MKLLSWWASSPDKPLNDHESRLRFRRADLAARSGRCDPPRLAEESITLYHREPFTRRLGAKIKVLHLHRGEWGPA
jgi:hypothetical protein